MRDDDLTLIGEHYGLGRTASRVFGIARSDRRQGLHIIGQSGTGKSSLMLDMIRQDIERGEGVTLIDPHGNLAVKAGSIAYRTAEQDRTRRLKREGPLGVLVR
jgi:hypothetical protein